MRGEGRKDIVFIEDILEAIGEIMAYVADGQMDKKTERAVERNIEIIGEAVRRISDELKGKYPDVEWREMVAMRNMLAHEYHKIDSDIVFHVATKEIVVLQEKITAIYADLSNTR